MFKLKQKHHKINLRTNDKFEIPNVKAARRKNSAIPNMIKHLNNVHKERLQIIENLNSQ